MRPKPKAPSLYAILGLHPEASSAELGPAVLRTRALHKGGRLASAIEEAAEILEDPRQRQNYDAKRRWEAEEAAQFRSPATPSSKSQWALDVIQTQDHVTAFVKEGNWKRVCMIFREVLPRARKEPGFEPALRRCCSGLAQICSGSLEAADAVARDQKSFGMLLEVVLVYQRQMRSNTAVLVQGLQCLAAVLWTHEGRKRANALDGLEGRVDLALTLLNLVDAASMGSSQDSFDVIAPGLRCLAEMGTGGSDVAARLRGRLLRMEVLNLALGIMSGNTFKMDTEIMAEGLHLLCSLVDDERFDELLAQKDRGVECVIVALQLHSTADAGRTVTAWAVLLLSYLQRKPRCRGVIRHDFRDVADQVVKQATEYFADHHVIPNLGEQVLKQLAEKRYDEMRP